MSQPIAQRPPQVTMAAGVVMFSSVLVLLTAWESLSSIRSLGTRDAVEGILADPPASGLGLGVDRVLDILYGAGVVAALCAVATAILGWYVLKPDRAARRALTIVAVPLFLTGLVAGGFAASFVAAGTAMLWMQPSREWFATGVWTPPSPPPSPSPATTSNEETAPRSETMAPMSPPGSPLVSRPASPSPHAPVYGSPPSRPRDLSLHERPGAVIAAFVLTVVTAGGVLVLSLLSLALVGRSRELIKTEFERRPELIEEGVTLAQLQLSIYVLMAAIVVWSGTALVFAGFMMARRAWARRALMVAAAFSAFACLLVAFSAPMMVVPAMAALATLWSLRRTEVRRWFAPEQR